ncbi:MAG: GMC oxidoreductase, partial [Chloroflexota bacterium]
GNPGWAWDDVLPTFNRLEADLDFGDQPWHGKEGPIPVTRYPDIPRTDIHAAVVDALETAGFPPVEDHNAPGAIGVGRMPMNSRDGVRVTTASAYLPLGRTPSNLTIRSDTQVDQVAFEGTKAIGVRLLDGTVIGAGMVVLCAGTYGSPLILMRSGIGPAEHLREAGIPVRVDLPGVGANLADHPAVEGVDLGYRGEARSAPLLHSVATWRSAGARPDAPPDLMIWVSDPDTPDNPPQLTIEVVLLMPRSRGHVRLRSADPIDPPRITLPHLEDPADLARLVEGYRRVREVAASPEIRRLCSDPPSPEITDPDELRQMILREGYSVPHVVGTCTMGPSPDAGAVVDATGRVHGTDGLRVADASMMPSVPSGFTHLPTIMIAERLAELIAASTA